MEKYYLEEKAVFSGTRLLAVAVYNIPDMGVVIGTLMVISVSNDISAKTAVPADVEQGLHFASPVWPGVLSSRDEGVGAA